MFSDSMMLGGGRKAAFSIANSVRLDGTADYFTHTPSVKGNSKTFTISFWYKTGYDRYLFSCGTEFNNRTSISTNSYALQIHCTNGGSVVLNKISSAVFKDPTSWYHVAVKFDVGEVHAYVNGEEITSWYLNVNTLGNADTNVNNNCEHIIGENLIDKANGYGLNGYISDFTIVDGAALDASHFGETDPTTGSWRPKNPDVTDYGTNGFHLDFADPANLGQDVSGNGNHWTPVSLGAADVVADSPTNNFSTWNILDPQDIDITYANGSRTVSGAPANSGTRATMSVPEGNWYWEETLDSIAGSRVFFGAASASCDLSSDPNAPVGLWGIDNVINKYDNGTETLGWASGMSAGNRVGVAVSRSGTTYKLWFRVNGGAWLGSGDPASGANPTNTFSTSEVVHPIVRKVNATAFQVTGNWGQTAFADTPPAGFKTLCTANLPTPVIKSPRKHFDVVTYTGTGTAQSITGLDFQPDLVWCKRRDNAESHGIYDSLRGPTKMLSSDTANAEATEANGVVSFDTGGFTANGATATNSSGGNYAAWCWKAGGAAVANTDGSIPSQVSANPTAGFSIVKTTTMGSGVFTIGHGLGSVPSLILWKSLGVNDWGVYHSAPGVTKASLLNSTMAFTTSSAWDNTAPTAAVFSVSGWGANDYVAYCWAEIPGFSKFGSYTGNGSSDGPFIHCGFRPRWVLVKITDAANDWTLLDSGRSPENPVDEVVYANLPNSEVVNGSHKIDFLANGFKIRSTDSYATINGSGHTYIYAAFAEYPFGGAKTTPAKAR